MFGEKNGEIELASAYAQKFGDAGNSAVTLMFALAFGAYAVLGTTHDVRCLAQQWIGTLLTLSVVGNMGILILVYMFYFRERQLVKLVTDNKTVAYTVFAAWRARLSLLLFNFGLYLFVLIALAHALRHGCVALDPIEKLVHIVRE
jgi:hypothetical protein